MRGDWKGGWERRLRRRMQSPLTLGLEVLHCRIAGNGSARELMRGLQESGRAGRSGEGDEGGWICNLGVEAWELEELDKQM